MSPQTVSQYYLDGIKEGREAFKREGMEFAVDHLVNLASTIKRFPAKHPVGRMLRGERDFWKNQMKKGT